MTKKRNRLSANEADVVFSYEDGGDPEQRFKEYVQRLLSHDGKPFDCLNLAILPESVGIIRGDESGGSITYQKGALVCFHGVEYDLEKRCRLGHLWDLRDRKKRKILSMEYDFEEKELSLTCPISNITLVTKIKRTESKE